MGRGDRSLRGIIQLPTLTRDADAAADGGAQKLSRIKEQSYRMSEREPRFQAREVKTPVCELKRPATAVLHFDINAV